jgi:hypothetical protein
MAIYVDALFDTGPFTRPSTPRCFRNTLASHMWSDRIGEEGTRELLAFAVKVGLRADWIQKRGTPDEHFDLVAKRRARAVALGAVETNTPAFAWAAEVKRRAMVTAGWYPAGAAALARGEFVPGRDPVHVALMRQGFAYDIRHQVAAEIREHVAWSGPLFNPVVLGDALDADDVVIPHEYFLGRDRTILSAIVFFAMGDSLAKSPLLAFTFSGSGFPVAVGGDDLFSSGSLVISWQNDPPYALSWGNAWGGGRL